MPKNDMRINSGTLGFLCLLAVVMAARVFAADAPAPVSHEAANALLATDWAAVRDLCGPSEALAESPVLRALKGHACLALNSNDDALLLFLSLNNDADQAAWKEWALDFAAKNPSSAAALYLKGDALARTGQWPQAIDAYSAALEADKDFALALNARGVALAHLKDYDGARCDLEAAAAAAPDFADAWASLGALKVLKEAPEGAADCFRTASLLSPASLLVLNGLGCAQYGSGRLDEAERNFQEASKAEALSLLASRNLHALRAKAAGKTTAPPGVSIRTEQFTARPGDLIVRQGFGEIPHTGILGKDAFAYDLRVEKMGGKDYSVIGTTPWNNDARFKNPGFFSVLDSNIPVKYNDRLTTFMELPSTLKESIRGRVCELADSQIGKTVGEYSLLPKAGSLGHCGDWSVGLYDQALKEHNITVERYKGLSAFTMDKNGLVDGQLRHWLVNDPTGGFVMDPWEISRRLPSVSQPQTVGGATTQGIADGWGDVGDWPVQTWFGLAQDVDLPPAASASSAQME